VPASLEPGRYQLLLSTSRGDPRAGTWITVQAVRVRAGAAQRATRRPAASVAARSRWASPAEGSALIRHFHAPAAVPG